MDNMGGSLTRLNNVYTHGIELRMILLHIESLPRQVTKGQLLGFINSVPGMERQRVGRIDLRADAAIIEIPVDWQVRLVQALDGRTLGQRRVRVWAESRENTADPEGDHFTHMARLLEMEIALVRSNAQAEIGFLQEVRRMNVAMTRARRKLLVIGDSVTLCADPFYSRMIEYFETLGAYRTVWEEEDVA